MSVVDEFLSQYSPDINRRVNKLLNAFTEAYTVEKIKKLTLEEYYHTGNHNTFCYRLEKGLVEYSSMGNVFPNAYGVYIDSAGCIKVNKTLSNKVGNDSEKVFSYLKGEIVRLLEFGGGQDYAAIDSIELDQRVKFKLLSVYYPEKYFPVCAMPTARDYCRCFGIFVGQNDSMMDLNRKLVSWRNEHLDSTWSLYQTMALSEWMRHGNKVIEASFRIKDDDKEIARKLDSEFDLLNLVGETREAVVKMRVNQGVFRDKLISQGMKCKLCGVNNVQVLVASHIKPWCESLPEEKLDSDNGFLMCPNHDKLFDRGLITFGDDGRIIISSRLTDVNRLYLNVKDDMRIELTDGNRKYLKYHRENVFIA